MQLLHGHGVLQPAVQSVRRGARGRRSDRSGATSPARRSRAGGFEFSGGCASRGRDRARAFSIPACRFNWTFQASTDLAVPHDDEEVELLGASGVSHIGFGTESASPEVLRWMNKRHQHIPDICEAARKCARAGIRVTFNLIFGYPGEEERHRRETLRVMGEIAARFDNVTFSPNMFTPYPGIPIWPRTARAGSGRAGIARRMGRYRSGQQHVCPGCADRSYETSAARHLLFPAGQPAEQGAAQIAVRSHSDLCSACCGEPLHWRLRNHFFAWPARTVAFDGASNGWWCGARC